MHALTDLPGMGGLYFSMVFSGSLSTISSGISSLAANTVEDLMKTPLKNINEATVTFITKVFVFGYGLLIIGLAFSASYLKGPMTSMMISSVGACGGPILGIFILGSLVPWSNKYGAICGGVIALVFNVWLAIGNIMYGSNLNTLPPPPSDMCFQNSSMLDFTSVNASMTYFKNQTLYSRAAINTMHGQIIKRDRYSFFLYDISGDWYGFIGTIVCFLFGITISYCTRRRCIQVTDAKLLFACVRQISSSKRSNGVEEHHDPDGNCTLLLYKPDLQVTTLVTNGNANHDVEESHRGII
ncbi:unnamed protein product [Candidula unifasciata]|uniref:Sodium-coupled monocarboxylate transporter 1 n=1 Tax=Candidula unifasciata TaxID=100452 RepID=A0A8S3ZAJ9_9EUPU|nr:unnamed protein product [Candidula unifasciata]